MMSLLWILLVLLSAAVKLDAHKCPPMEACDDFPGCVERDSHGCNFCNCPRGQGVPIYIPPAGPQSYSQHRPRRSCPPMEPCDDFEGCVEVGENGCRTCNCPAGQGKVIDIALATYSYSLHMDSNGLSAANDTAVINGSCPPMEPCDDFEGCVDVDDKGCHTCGCPAGQGKFIHITPATYSYSQQWKSEGLAAANDTDAIDDSCPPMEPCDDIEGCVEVDDNGCRTCNCPAGQGKLIQITPADPYSYSQHMDSKGLAVAKDTNATDGSCPPMEPCDDFKGCVEVDDNGCHICNCPTGQAKYIHITPAPYLYSQHMDSNGHVSEKNTKAINGSCPPMEPCDDIEGCVEVDDNGCRTCNCPAGQGKLIHIAPADPYSYSQHMDSKGLAAAKNTNAIDENP